MEKQTVLFKLELERRGNELLAVRERITPERREAAISLLAELMARSVVDGKEERNAEDAKGEGDE